MKRTSQRIFVASLVGGLSVLGAAAAFSESVENLLRRYPYDPACVWGRISNGKGMIVRCLTEQEANGMAATAAPAAAAPAASTPSTTPATPAEVTPAETAPATSGKLEITVGPVVADKGELGVGKLGAPKDKYEKCIEDNGGLKGDKGEVHIRFLVRSKGIAEGVSVQKRINVSPEAARCIADVVDRRRVGVPDEPLVGATLIMKLARTSE
jgi:hypothetical protein